MAYTAPTTWVDGSGNGTPITAAALNLRDANVADHQSRIAALESSATPVTVTYAASVTLNAALGRLFRITAPGNITLADITGGTDGQVITLEVLASGGNRTVTVAGGGTTNVTSGTWWSGTFRYNAGADVWLII